jgi:hypothetical protein
MAIARRGRTASNRHVIVGQGDEGNRRPKTKIQAMSFLSLDCRPRHRFQLASTTSLLN